MIPSIVDYRVGIFPFNVNKCDVTRVIFKQKVFNHHNVLNDQSLEHDVAGITATICTTLEHFGNVPNRSFSYITLSISETVMWPDPRTRRKLAYIFCSASRISLSILLKLSNAGETFLIRCFTVTEFSKHRLFHVHFHWTWAQVRLAPCRWTHSKCSYGGAIPMSAAFVFALDHLQGLKGCAIEFVWVPWLLVTQTENWLTIT